MLNIIPLAYNIGLLVIFYNIFDTRELCRAGRYFAVIEDLYWTTHAAELVVKEVFNFYRDHDSILAFMYCSDSSCERFL